jgi:predicted Zn-dependent protease
MSVGDEKKLGRDVAAKFLAAIPQSEDPAAREFIRRIGRRLIDASGTQLFDFTFYLVKDPSINAFAVPGGYVFVNTGLIVSAASEEEVAGVIAHEIGHVTARHIAQQVARSTAMSLVSLAATLGAIFLAKDPKTAAAVSSAGMAASATEQLRYSREMEEQADRLGFQTMLRGGYDPRGMVGFMRKILAEDVFSDLIPNYLTTHPGPEQRVIYLDGLVASLRGSPPPAVDPARFARVRTRVLVEQKDAATAVTHFTAEVRDRPTDVNALYGLALAYQKGGKSAEARAAFGRALALAPGDPDLVRDLGIGLLLAGRAEEGIARLKEAIDLAPQDGVARYFLGVALKERGEFAEAARAFQRAVEIDPDHADALYNLGISLGNAGDECRAFHYLGLYSRKVGDNKQARAYFERALSVCPAESEFKAKTVGAMDDAKKETP